MMDDLARPAPTRPGNTVVSAKKFRLRGFKDHFLSKIRNDNSYVMK